MPVPEGGGGGGGGGGPIPHLIVAPGSPYNLGTQVTGGTLTGQLSVRSSSADVNWSILSNSNPAFVVGPPTFGDATTTPTTIPVSITEAVAGSYTTTVLLKDLSTNTTRTVVINATFVAAGAMLIATPASITFPQGVLNQTLDVETVTLSNNTGGAVVVTSIGITGLTFGYVGPATPFTIPNGGNVIISLQTDYSIVGVLSGVATVNSVLGPLTISLHVTVLFLNSVDVLQNTSRAILLAGNLTKKFDGTNFDPALDCVLIFNDTFWDNPGNEKVLRRVEVLYENVGVCTGLKLDIATWRQTLTPPAFDTDTDTITIGDVSADLSERSAFFDVELAGELIVPQLTRLSSTGPVSILALIPHFEDKGEKVESV